jgi:hypothetical protein
MGVPECQRLRQACLQSRSGESSRKSVNMIVLGNGQPSPDNFISPIRLNALVSRARHYQRYILAKSVPSWLPPLRAKTAASVEAE